ncbi:Hypothetical predicted protein [Olea europaea subsp. europaea]|uniref:Uncharacterized protein n=1 Tax=Olea europaea subsp. europaea TaxID=158383 RepID=A0A8S0RRJ4_OLEEU|nr:Hypothetical predicted protein [Olea europaea subsp. europaea]
MYTIHDFPIAMQVWAYEAVPEIGERFGQRVGERMPRLLIWFARKQPQHRTYNAFFKNVQLHVYTTIHPTDVEAEQQYFFALVSYDDPPVPVLDDIARTVVGPQFNASHAGNGSGGQLTRQDFDNGVSSGGSTEDETSEDDDGDRQSGSDRDDDDTEDSGVGACERSSDGEDTRRGQTGASSTPRVPHVSSPVRGPTMETRPIGTSGSNLTRGEVEELLLDQRILLEMQLRTVKLEIEQHVMSECKKFRDFLTTFVALAGPTPIAVATPTDTEAEVLDVNGGDVEPFSDEQDIRADTGTAHVQANGGDIVPCLDDEHHLMPAATDEQLDGGVMECSHATPINDTEFEGYDVMDDDGDLTEIPVPATVAEPGHEFPTTR